MSQVLIKIKDVDPNNTEAVKDALSPFFQQLQKHKEYECYKWLQALECVINRFPKYCASHRPAIESYLVHFLDSNNYQYVIEAAKCAHSLQQVKPVYEKAATAKTCWRDLMGWLCGAAHQLLGAVFPHAVDIHGQGDSQAVEGTESPLGAALSDATVAKGKKQISTSTRLRNVFVFIQAMLVEPYPCPKPVRPQCILSAVARALSVSGARAPAGRDGGAPDTELAVQALRSLDALLLCLGPNLVPFSSLVFRCVTQTLKWSEECPGPEAKSVRVQAYATARRCAAAGRARAPDLARHVLRDVTPRRQQLQITQGSAQPNKHMSKKAKRKLANTMLMESNISAHVPGEKNKVHATKEEDDDVAIAALECLETLFIVCGTSLKPTVHKALVSTLVRSCHSLSHLSPRALYLLRALHAARAAGSGPVLHHCLHVFSKHVASEQEQISQFCRRALVEIHLQLHAAPATLSYAAAPDTPDAPDAGHAGGRTHKLDSHRNRAVLEALLGPDKLPPQNNEEVITIGDEPANKRPRMDEKDDNDDDDDDKISVSSDSSDASVEICEGLPEEENRPVKDNKDMVCIQIDEVDGKFVEENTQLDDTSDAEKENSLSITIESIYNKHNKVFADTSNIHEAATQMPSNSIDNEEEETPLSMEVAYDHPNSSSKVAALETLEEESLPSTNDTDDIQITCGQVTKSQEQDGVKKTESKSSDEPKVNGIDKSAAIQENGVDEHDGNIVNIEAKNTDGVSVEDMLADFVDEVNDDTAQSNPA